MISIAHFMAVLTGTPLVNSTWMMISLIRADPTIAVAPAIRNELTSHFQKTNIDGELIFLLSSRGRARTSKSRMVMHGS